MSDAPDLHPFNNYAWKQPLTRRLPGRVSLRSKAAGIPIHAIPANTFAPVITGAPILGAQLTASAGTWTQLPSLLQGPPLANVTTNPPGTSAITGGRTRALTSRNWDGQSITYLVADAITSGFFFWEWLRNGAPIIGGVGPYYTIQAADVGQALSVQVTASNFIGTSSPAFARTVTPAA